MLAKPTCLHIPPLYEGGAACITWEHVNGVDGYELDCYAEIGELHTHGITWQNITYYDFSWKQIDEKNLTWSNIHDLPVIFTIFKGAPTAKQELTWGIINNLGLTWSEINDKSMSWENFHDRTHVSFTTEIPIYTKKALFRVRAIKGEDYSEYLMSARIDTLPRSLADCKPPCLHISGLREDGDTEIIWGSLYGAQGYVLERKLGDKDFVAIFSGQGDSGIEPTKKENYAMVSAIRDADTHYRFIDHIPLHEKTVTYRVKAYNSTDSSQYFESVVIPIIPALYRNDSFAWIAVKDNTYRLEIRGDNICEFSGIVFNLEYFDEELALINLAAQMPDTYTNPGVIPQANLEILSHENGKVRFMCNRVIPSGEEWSGIVTVLEFKSRKSDNVQIKLY